MRAMTSPESSPLGKAVEYGSEADLIRRIRTIESEIATGAGTPKPRRSLASFRKG